MVVYRPSPIPKPTCLVILTNEQKANLKLIGKVVITCNPIKTTIYYRNIAPTELSHMLAHDFCFDYYIN